jgi:multiple sugar transport system ATP-binding protein
MSSVQIRDVRKSFGTFEVLHGVTIPIEDGEFVVLVGPSGCGKSTLLRMLAGLENITSGTISIGDRVVNNVQPKERDIAMVFQNYALYPHMTVADNMGFSLKLRGARADEIKKGVARAAEILALTPLLDRYPRQLSGGQRQRVAMGRAIVRDPQVFLFDEPLSNLDAKLRLEMRHEIRRIHREVKRTTIYVTHDQDEALSLADRIVVLQDGRVQQVGTPEDLYLRPATIAVARFMGYRNIIALAVERVDGRRVTLAGDGLRLHGIAQAPITGNRAVVAMRPEDITFVQGENAIAGTVDQVEYCGRDYLVDVVTAAGTVYLCTERHIRPDETAQLSIAPERVLVFPAEGGT